MNRTILVSGVIVMGLLSFLFGCGKQNPSTAEQATSQYRQAEAYCGLRSQALSITAEDLQLSGETDQPLLVLMEMGRPEAVATLLSAADGSASIYFSNGGGIIGAGEHESVRDTAHSFLHFAYEARSEMQKVVTFPLPNQGEVKFYLVTTNGVFTASALEDNLGNMREKLSPLFHKGHEVITAIRLATEEQ